jgi:hypothetical protein
MEPIKCFMLNPTGIHYRYLRRYSCTGKSTCIKGNYHDAMNLLDEITDSEERTSGDLYPHDHALWPTKCEHCDYKFTEEDEWQLFHQEKMQRSDNQEFCMYRNAPAGAMWFADWMPWRGEDGHCLIVVTPDGFHWDIDGRASNCSLPNDNEHKCWVRHGVPPIVTVDKNGKTCNAGGGSIGTPNWHGFLRNGYLVI